MEFTTQQRLLLERKQRRRAPIDTAGPYLRAACAAAAAPRPPASWRVSFHASPFPFGSAGAPPSIATSAETACPSLAA